MSDALLARAIIEDAVTFEKQGHSVMLYHLSRERPLLFQQGGGQAQYSPGGSWLESGKFWA